MTPEQQETLVVAHAAKDSGFKRVEIAPEDLIALLNRIAELERDIDVDDDDSLIAERRVISKPGAAIKVTELILTPQARRDLTIGATSLGKIR